MEMKVIDDMVPSGYRFLNQPRPNAVTRGVGIIIIFRKNIKICKCKDRENGQFENIEVTLTCGKQAVRILCVYRPPPSPENGLSVSTFLKDFKLFLSASELPSKNVLVLGDLNFHVDDPKAKEKNSCV